MGALASLPAHAQTGPFTGATVQGALSVAATTIDGGPVLHFTGPALGEALSKVDHTTLGASVGLAYTFGLGERFTLGLAFDANPIHETVGTTTGGEANIKSRIAHRYSLSLVPGMVLDKDSLVYGRIGYAGAKVDNQFIVLAVEGGVTGNVNGNDYKGYVIGVGYRHFFEKNVYVFGELAHTAYRAERIAAFNAIYVDRKMHTDEASVGLGYRF